MLRSLRAFSVLAAVSCAAAIATAPAARAQRIDVELFRPNVDGRGLFGVDGTTTHAPWDFGLGFFMHYANSLLRLSTSNPSDPHADDLNHRLTGTFVASVGITKRLELGVSLPFSFVNTYRSDDLGTIQGAGLGSLVLSAKYRILREEDHGVGLAFLGALGTPTGRDNSFLAEGNVVFQPAFLLEKGLGPVRLLLHAGASLRETAYYNKLSIGHSLDLRFGIGWKVHEAVELGAEVLTTLRPFNGNAGHAAEIVAGARFFPANQVSLWVGAGPGLTDQVGAPAFRIFGGILLAPLEKDTDGDGVADRFDRCPKDPGPASNRGCPEPAKKKDEPKKEAPPAKPEAPKPEAPKPTPPPPADADGDGVPDTDDACPQQKGPASNKGCPEKGVVVTKGEVKITEQVNFRTGKAQLRRDSHQILDQVAEVLAKFPDLQKLEIQGHTDDQGRRATNERLSLRRAEAVKAYLVKRGVAEGRLVAKGYGSSVPVTPVTASMSRAERAAARAKNRRVQFIILEHRGQ